MAGGCRLHRRVGQFKVDDPGHYYSVANTRPFSAPDALRYARLSPGSFGFAEPSPG